MFKALSVSAQSPIINSISPSSGTIGNTITIFGANFSSTNAVKFGGISATSFLVVNSTTIIAVVGTGASGAVSVVSSIGTGTLGGFTFSTQNKSPGGIPSFLWLDANKGILGTTTVASWADQSGNGKDLVNGIGSKPLISTNGINFNPSIYFDGVSDYMTRATGIL
ncbi:MAG: IPT/TIG domain-containing protein, partial [Cytophagales bacterium]|nr:IPT/TIG domain-containing protein [Cytophagales bacterium]